MGIVNPGKWLLSAVGSLVQPIFAKGQLIAGLKVAQVKYEQALNTWQNKVLNAGSVSNGYLREGNPTGEKLLFEGLLLFRN